VDSKKDIKKTKGVKNNVVARTITFDDYTRGLNEEIEMTRRQSCIRSKLHEVYTIFESKIALIWRQTIRRTELDGDITVGALADTFVICYYYVLFIVIYTFFHIYINIINMFLYNSFYIIYY